MIQQAPNRVRNVIHNYCTEIGVHWILYGQNTILIQYSIYIHYIPLYILLYIVFLLIFFGACFFPQNSAQVGRRTRSFSATGPQLATLLRCDEKHARCHGRRVTPQMTLEKSRKLKVQCTWMELELGIWNLNLAQRYFVQTFQRPQRYFVFTSVQKQCF